MQKNRHIVTQKKPDRIPETLKALLLWYENHERDVPWRRKDGQKPDPYAVWLSEIMCQQTTVQAVKPYYHKFLARWPTVEALAQAPEQDILEAWAGLGYYARARNLHKCAQVISLEHGGVFPEDQKSLKALPGIGAYTSAALSAIAFGHPATVVDGNVERVLSRFFAVETPLPESRKHLRALADDFFKPAPHCAGDIAQALMDLGADICIAGKTPRCAACPLRKGCKGLQAGIAQTLPRKNRKKSRPQKYGHVYWITAPSGQVLFCKRPDKGLFAGMTGLPTTAWLETPSALTHLPFLQGMNTPSLEKKVSHTFTHFDLELSLYERTLSTPCVPDESYYWEEAETAYQGLPSLFKKATALFRQASFPYNEKKTRYSK